ncbi:MAG TPA: CBS domain-containing protein [Candidatus Dormibacteraeota bacterium]|nr:CBS domain-containing protein [Candidatus Dormibacteraeota bacterium]
MIVKDLMSQNVHSCSPKDSLQRAAEIMWNSDCGAIPVIDAGARVVGMITDRDVCMHALMCGRRLQDCPVADAMSADVCACGSSDSVDAAQTLMRKRRVRRLPVVDGHRHLIGILSINDLALHVGRDKRDSCVAPEALAATLTGVSVHGQPGGA